MAMVVRAFPLKEGRTRSDVEKFVRELEEREGEVSQWHATQGVTHESWYLQETDAGPWVIVVNEGSDVKESARRFAQAATDFDTWFKRRVEDLTGVDLSAAPLGPPTTPVYAWSQDEQTRMKFAPFQG